MADKKDPGKFTVRFNIHDPQHQTVVALLPAAGTVSAGALKSFFDGIDNLRIGIELDSHVGSLFPYVLCDVSIIANSAPLFCNKVTLQKFS